MADQKKKKVTLETDKDLPEFPTATIGRFAPLTGQFAVIADE